MSADVPCPCPCRPGDEPCGQRLAGIELTWGVCILCHDDDHWQEGDDDPLDWSFLAEVAS